MLLRRSRRVVLTISANCTYDLGDFYIRSRLLALFFEPEPVDRFGVPCGHLLFWRHVPAWRGRRILITISANLNHDLGEV